jgi:ABC-type glycerol-3-phosphate transport system substrate-binding protein
LKKIMAVAMAILIALPVFNTYASEVKMVSLPDSSGVVTLETNERVLTEGDFITYYAQIPQNGYYALLLRYAAMPGSKTDMELSVEINGEVPFKEANACVFPRSWRYASTEPSFDNRGNMIRPVSQEVFLFQEAYAMDKEGFHTEPLLFYLTAGVNEITLRSIREPIVISGIKLTPPPEIISYAELSKSYTAKNIANAGEITVLAIDAARRSSPSILPVSDLSNPYLEPFNLTNITYNTLGGSMWGKPGQSIVWEMEIPEDGLYALSFVYRQDVIVGLPVARTLTINGEIPFAEAKAVVFPYGNQWQRLTLQADGGDALVYLTKGTHEIGLTVTLGPIAELCRKVSDISAELSALYTQIVMITGPNPDNMRDYRIDARLPNIIPDFYRLAHELDEVTDAITALGAGRNDALTVSIMAAQLHDFAAKPDSIPGRMGRFKDNIINLAIWVLMSSEMPLTLYSISAHPPEREHDAVNPGFWANLWFSIQRFIASFTTRAEMTGNRYDENEENLIEVWGAYGKDASEILKRLCDEVFTPETGIKVNYNLLSNENMMFFNIASKTGPDVCLNIGRGYPLDLGLRDAAVDIAALPGFSEFEKRFTNDAFIPLSFDGKVYGFPVGQGIPVMYVRTDIFENLGLKIPQTWDEFYATIGALGVHNLQVSPAGDLITIFLVQRGGTFFDEALTKCILDDVPGIRALTEWTDLFTLHGAPVASDFFNRFRTGEMPIGIADITLYNMLDYAALEIKGSWAMFPVPGTPDENGEINRTIITGGTSGIITKSRPERLDNAWTFVQWFASEEIQTRFCLELEAILGPSARYNTAVVASHASIPWDKHSFDTIMYSVENVTEIPGIPGGYFVGRHIQNAFNEIVLQGEQPRVAMQKYVEVINAEINRKRTELGLN